MLFRSNPGEPPLKCGPAICDFFAGVHLYGAIVTALLERQFSGEGQWVQSSLLQAQIALLDFQAARYLMKGEIAGQVGNDHPVGMPTSAYTTSDGYLNINSLGQAMWVRLCKALGKEDLADHPDYKGPPERSKNRKALNAALNELFKTRTTAEWIDILLAADVPCGPIYKMDQVFADPQEIGRAHV